MLVLSWQVVALVVASNMDDLSVGFALGLKRTQIPWGSVTTIAVFSGLTMGAGLLLGQRLAGLLPAGTGAAAAAGVFILLGLWFLAQEFGWWPERDPAALEALEQRRITPVGAVVLGGLLGVDSLALGLSGGLAGYPALVASVLAFAVSFAFIAGGARAGERLAEAGLIQRPDLVAAVLLFLLAGAELMLA